MGQAAPRGRGHEPELLAREHVRLAARLPVPHQCLRVLRLRERPRLPLCLDHCQLPARRLLL